MSKEVQGDAPADAGAPTPASPAAGPAGASGPAGWPTRVVAGIWARAGSWAGAGAWARRTTSGGSRAVGSTLAVTAAAAGGWLAAGAWQPPAPTPAPEAVTAVAVDARADGSRPSPVRARIRVSVANAGSDPVSVVGFEPAGDGGFIAGLDPRRLLVPAGGSADLQLQIGVRCNSATPLGLPGLRIRRPDGGIRPVTLTGAADALATLCTRWPGQEPMVLDQIRPDGNRLALVVRVPGGRSTRIDAVYAGSVPLVVSPLPTTVDGGRTTIWLQPPARCPVRWQVTGIPEQITIRIEVGGPAELTVPLGPAMADWVLATACRPVTR